MPADDLKGLIAWMKTNEGKTSFGTAGAGQTLPASGAYDGLGIDELAAYFPAIGAFGVRPYGTSGAADEIDYIGMPGAGKSLPAPADYTGAGYTELGVYEPSIDGLPISGFVYSTERASNVVGVSEGALLPKSGPWLVRIKQFFGVLLLAVAAWIVSPLFRRKFSLQRRTVVDDFWCWDLPQAPLTKKDA